MDETGKTPQAPRKVNAGVIVGAIFGVVILALLVAGLTQGDEEKPAAPVPSREEPVAAKPDSTAAPAAGDPAIKVEPSQVTLKDESLSFEADLPAAPANDPVIAYLRRDAERYAQRMHPLAEAGRMRAQSQAGRLSQGPWEVKVKWAYSAKAGPLVSLIGESFEDMHGAHPNTVYDTHIAEAATGHPMKFDEMFLPSKSPSPAFAIGVCEALKAAKQKRIGSETILDEPIVCVGPGANLKLEEASVALAPSDVPDRFGGAYVLYSAYTAGSHAEGPYKLVVQQEVFAGDLRPDYKQWFAGNAPEPN